MVVLPPATPVTTPVPATTVATDVLSEDQLPPGCVELNVVVEPAQTVCVPLKVPALGGVVTVTVRVAVALEQPPVPVTV